MCCIPCCGFCGLCDNPVVRILKFTVTTALFVFFGGFIGKYYLWVVIEGRTRPQDTTYSVVLHKAGMNSTEIAKDMNTLEGYKIDDQHWEYGVYFTLIIYTLTALVYLACVGVKWGTRAVGRVLIYVLCCTWVVDPDQGRLRNLGAAKGDPGDSRSGRPSNLIKMV